MSEHFPQLDLERINQGIADRSDVFYWQTDRKVEPAVAGQIWADRHRYFTDEQLLDRVNQTLTDDKLAAVVPFDPDAQTNLGNVSSVRSGVLESGQEVIIRAFPRGVKNGYFHAEAAAADQVREAGLPSYKTFGIHDFEGGDDFAFHVLEKLPFTAVQVWLKEHPADEPTLVQKIGAMMARLHKIEVNGFGPFDNERAQAGELVGLHSSYGDAVRAALPFNLDVLVREGIFTTEQRTAIERLFEPSNPLLQATKSVLVHNDFADWNLLTDGQDVTGIIDFDECVGGDPISDIACWSTFFEAERLKQFLRGYWTVADKPADFEEKFELLRLRYTISKMTLRLRRYSWDPSDFMKEKIETGRAHLAQSMEYFGI